MIHFDPLLTKLLSCKFRHLKCFVYHVCREKNKFLPLAVSLTTSIIRSRKLVHPVAASGVRAGPRALVKYFKTTSVSKLGFKNKEGRVLIPQGPLMITKSFIPKPCTACILVTRRKFSIVCIVLSRSSTHLSRKRKTVAVCLTNLGHRVNY